MRCYAERLVRMLMTLTGLFLVVMPVSAADPEIDRLLLSPIGKDWVTNGGNLTNQRYSTLKQINTSNVKQLKGAWMTRLKGSGLNAKYSFEASPLVKDGIMYVITGNDDVFALNAKTGEILWQYWSGLAGKRALCCGWANRGLAMAEGLLFFGQLDVTVVALDMKTGEVVWKTPIENYEHGYSITSAPLYYDGIRGAVQIIARAHRTVMIWRTVAGREVDQPECRIEGRRVPDWRPPAHRIVRAGRPGIAAQLARPRQGIVPPQDGAGLGVQGGEAPAYPILPTGDAAVEDAVVVERRAGDRVAMFIVLNRRLPDHFAQLHV